MAWVTSRNRLISAKAVAGRNYLVSTRIGRVNDLLINFSDFLLTKKLFGGKKPRFPVKICEV